jgi:hypothetical protein
LSSGGIWTPVPEGPHEEFVQRLHRAIAAFGEESGVESPIVEVDLMDGSRFVLQRIDPEPGYGMVTLHVQADEDDETPDALIVPLGTIKRIELRKSPESRVAGVGFSVPPA